MTDDGRQDDGRRMPSDGKSSHCLWKGWQCELKGSNKTSVTGVAGTDYPSGAPKFNLDF